METPALIPLAYATPLPSRPARPLALVAIALATVLAGAVVGATTNAINGAIGPIYFVNVMGWQNVSNVWFASILQGVFEGSVVGILLSVVLTTTIGIVSRVTCSCATGLCWLGGIMLGVYGTWTIGGICGVALASLSPLTFQDTFVGVPNDHIQMLRFAWVGGSIWGAEFGGFLVVIVSLILFRMHWRRILARDHIAYNPTP